VLFSDFVNQILLPKMRLRGLRNAKEQFILAATVQNVKRLSKNLSQPKEAQQEWPREVILAIGSSAKFITEGVRHFGKESFSTASKIYAQTEQDLSLPISTLASAVQRRARFTFRVAR